MDIYIDCEWNSFGGELISMALVADNGKEFYEVLNCENPVEWVAENVMPILNKSPISAEKFKLKLGKFLMQFESVNIIADWPEDIEKFCNALITGAGTCLNTPPLSMNIIRINAKSELPHNALEDARGIRKAIQSI
ncbi:MAG: hypothetical protein HRU20_06530 [Pseudomonadales bacterium]|nr:hypothetical protein [Pseudomonadales bacterium]